MPLIQLHHQNKKTFESSFVAQKEINNHNEFREWMDDLWKFDPPQKGFQWLACEEKSPYFIGQRKEGLYEPDA